MLVCRVELCGCMLKHKEETDLLYLEHHHPCCACSSRAHAPMIAVGSDDSNTAYSGKVHIYEYIENTRKYTKAENLTVTDPVHDIAFAPNLGRSFHVLAIATNDLRIFKLIPMR
uniref:Uncharacterized protein n=1 Tax=Hucho hucho TaxID=62062 RepID=A0A4W5LE69_9TELE